MSDVENIEINSSDDADRVLSSIENSSRESSQNSGNTPEQAGLSDEFELSVGGKQIKAKRDEVLKWAQMGYDAPNKIGSLSKEVESYRSKQAEFQKQEQRIADWQKKYGEVDDYFAKNPQFRDHVLQAWQQKTQTFNDPSNPLAGKLTELEQRLSQVSQIAETFQQRELQEKMSKEDQALDSEIASIRKAYPTIDLASVDESGKSLEYRVLEYARDNGIKKFTTAFRDFYHDELKKNYEASGREAVLKEKQQNTKLGVLGITKEPVRRSSNDVRGKSYRDLEREIIEEYKLS